MDPLKAERHHKFVSGHSGGSVFELIGLLFIPSFVGYLKYKVDSAFYSKSSNSFKLYLDLIGIIVAVVLPCTLLSDYVLEIDIVLGTTVLLVYLKGCRSRFIPSIQVRSRMSAYRRLGRTFVLVYTCVCIYAVDFPIFPRRFAKTEVFGVSLMDVGVGLISIMMGFSNPNFLYAARERTAKQLLKTVWSSTIPPILIGGLRVVTVKALGYPEHITEYGVHWNFFFTIAFVRLAGFVTAYCLRKKTDFDVMILHAFLCVVVACIQQWLVIPLAHYLQPDLLSTSSSNSRDYEWGLGGLAKANAEGLVSLTGYFSLFLFGTFAALLMQLHLEPTPHQVMGDKLKILCVQGKQTWNGCAKRVSLAFLVISAMCFSVVVVAGPSAVSRRLVNLPYIALQMGIMAPLMAYFNYGVFESTTTEKRRKSTTQSTKDFLQLITLVADNGMAYFLICNLVTGVMNFLVDTLELAEMRPAWFAVASQFCLLCAYTVLCPVLAQTVSSLLFGRKKSTKKAAL